MNVITQGPTLANPESLNLAEARAELHKANLQLLQQADQLHRLNGALTSMGLDLTEIHMRKDAKALMVVLDTLVKRQVPADVAAAFQAPGMGERLPADHRSAVLELMRRLGSVVDGQDINLGLDALLNLYANLVQTHHRCDEAADVMTSVIQFLKKQPAAPAAPSASALH